MASLQLSFATASGAERLAAAQQVRHARRLLVAGNDASGKSTLCRQLSGILVLPYTEIDAVRFDAAWNDRVGWIEQVADLAAGSTWITEWDFDAVRETLGSRAEVLIWIDLRRRTNTRRALWRSIRGRLTRASLWGDTTEPPLHTILTNQWHSVRVAISHHDEARQITQNFVRDHPEITTVTLRTPRDVARFRHLVADAA
jgi:adenylate kinase family enzyme